MGKKTSSVSKKPSTAVSTGKSKKQSMKDRILANLASQHALGKKWVDKQALASLCTATNLHTFDTTCSLLKKGELVDTDGSKFQLTEDGLEKVGPDAAKPPVDNTEAQDMLKENLQGGNKTKNMFDLLTDGRYHSRTEIAKHVQMDPDAKTFKTYISYLSKLVEKTDDGKKCRLKDNAFPCGRPCNKKVEEEEDSE
jgi:hypothetical protein